MSPRVHGSCSIGAPIGSARLRSNEIVFVGTGEAAGSGVAAVDGIDRGRGTRGGMLTLRADSRGDPPGPNP